MLIYSLEPWFTGRVVAAASILSCDRRPRDHCILEKRVLRGEDSVAVEGDICQRYGGRCKVNNRKDEGMTEVDKNTIPKNTNTTCSRFRVQNQQLLRTNVKITHSKASPCLRAHEASVFGFATLPF